MIQDQETTGSLEAVGLDSSSVVSEDLRVPLPLDIDETDDVSENLFGGEDFLKPDVCLDSPQASVPCRDVSDTPLSDAKKRDLRSMIEDSCLSTQAVFKFKMPWERPGMRTVFDRKPKRLIPIPVLKPVEITSGKKDISKAVPLPSTKPYRGAFSEVINFNLDFSEQEMEDNLERKALEKWYLIFASGEDAWPEGFNLRVAVAEHRLSDMKLIFGTRSPNTIIRRGSSILQFIRWYRTKYFSLCPFPVNSALVEEYISALQADGKTVSAMRGFLEALNFCKHFLRMNVALLGQELVSAKVQRIIEVCDALKPEKQQARVLTVAEVEFLESCLTNEKMSLTDRVACGVMLFCLYSRSRWSDVKRIYGFVQDVKESEGKISGYLECRTRSHKTSRLVAKSGLAMPLVAPVWGVGNLPWGLIFIKLCQSSNRPVESLSNEPMLNAPTPDGSWSGRSVTTTEAGKWLRKILAGMKGDAIFTTIHALKATPLSWCAKWGLGPDIRALLGHHSTGKTSAECYGRDNLAKPLRDFDLVLQQIRTGAFSPDATRSGMIREESVQDPSLSYSHPVPSKPPIVQEREHASEEEESSSSSSESSSESQESSESDLEGDPVTRSKDWGPEMLMYRNRKTLIVHAVASGGADTFSCGVKITKDFEEIQSSNFLELRQCKRCATARPLKTAGQLASALKKLRSER